MINVLDHGYVKFVEAWGTGEHGWPGADYEVGIIEAARQSTQGGFRGWELDSKLLTYLFQHKHMTPFEMAGMTIEVQAPIFVFREWHRHRTQSYNEMSARYSPLPDLCYTPEDQDVYERAQDAAHNKNRQAGATIETPPDMTTCSDWVLDVAKFYEEAEALYKSGLERGIPKELARIVMPVGHYSRMRASANLRNWLAFLTLRMDPAAQWEIRQFANAVGEIISQRFPKTWGLFETETK